ncbi:Protein kinase-like domain containing protein [Naviculisporaceae sp. PSN 640]
MSLRRYTITLSPTPQDPGAVTFSPAEPARRCRTCRLAWPAGLYTNAQWALGSRRSQCYGCYFGITQTLPGAAPDPLTHGRYSNHSGTAEFTNDAFTNPLAKGGFRSIAKGKYIWGPMKGADCVGKWFRTAEVAPDDFYGFDIEVFGKAQGLVALFNAQGILLRPALVNQPLVAPPLYPRIPYRALIEPFLENWRNFNSNTGWTDDTDDLAQAMQALSHFSYHITDGRYLLCDLQGGIVNGQLILSDPVILSKDQEGGITDLGPLGISTFFSQHMCSPFCRTEWKTPCGNEAVAMLQVARGTTMTLLSGKASAGVDRAASSKVPPSEYIAPYP